MRRPCLLILTENTRKMFNANKQTSKTIPRGRFIEPYKIQSSIVNCNKIPLDMEILFIFVFDSMCIICLLYFFSRRFLHRFQIDVTILMYFILWAAEYKFRHIIHGLCVSCSFGSHFHLVIMKCLIKMYL